MNQRQKALLKNLDWQSQILASHSEFSFDEEPNVAKDCSVKAKSFLFLKQILNSEYFLQRTESDELKYRHTSEIFEFGSRPPQWSESYDSFGFPVHIKVTFTPYVCSLLCAIALCLKNVHILIKNYFIAQNY